MDWFEQPKPQDAVCFPVRVVTNGVLGGASDLPSPNYEFVSWATPEVLSVSSTTLELGSVIEVTRNLLGLNDTVVALGGDAAICGDLVEISQTNSVTVLECTLRAGRAGTHLLQILTQHEGGCVSDPGSNILVHEPAIDRSSLRLACHLYVYNGILFCKKVQLTCRAPTLLSFRQRRWRGQTRFRGAAPDTARAPRKIPASTTLRQSP